MMSDTWFNSSKEATCSNSTHVCEDFRGPAWGGMEGIKGERSEQQSDMVENHHQHGLDLGGFEVQKVRFFIKNSLGRSSKLCFLCGWGAHFYKKGGKRRPENENWVRKTCDGEFDAYMRRLGGTKSANVEKVLVF